MKVETPQILWNSEGDKGINAALNSISLLESGLIDPAPGGTSSSSDNGNATAGNKYGHVMVTAGNTDIINLWKLSFPSSAPSSSSATATNSSGIFQKHNPSLVTTSSTTTTSSSSSTLPTFSSNAKIAYLCSLTRQEQSVNTVAFSPDGLHLATGGETGAIVLWSVPPSMRGNGNGRHFWSTVEREQDLSVRIVCRSGQGICDISWSADSKRFIVGTIDHSVFVCEDKNYDANHRSVTTSATGGTTAAAVVPVDSEWEVVYRNTHDHTHYVQGVAYDPLGVYLASMGSDRTVRVFPRKTPPKSKKKVLRPVSTNSTPLKEGNASNNQENLGNGGSGGGIIPPIDHQRMVDQLLTESKLEISSRSKMIKFRRASDTNGDDSVADNTENNNATAENQANNNNNRPARRNLYADESTLQSFFRRLSWTADGAFLVTPSALWYADEDEESNSGENDDNKASPSFATYLFARHQFDEPYKVLLGLEKPSVVIRPSPIFFKLPSSGTPTGAAQRASVESKENQSPSVSSSPGLPYRSVFAVLTTDSILVYDTHHTRPLSVVRGLHYAGLSDCQWSSDGLKLVVSSIDGYISIVTFDYGELGEVYKPPTVTTTRNLSSLESSSPLQAPRQGAPVSSTASTHNCRMALSPKPNVNASTPLIPPCEPGQTATIEAPPSKRAKTRITPTLISSAPPAAKQTVIPTVTPKENHSKRPVEELLEHETKTVGEAVTKLTLENDEKPKKKKRIQPMLVSTGN